MIAVDDQPFSVVENPGFMNLISKLSGYQLKGRKFYKNLISKQYEDLKNRLKTIISQSAENGLSFTTDLWSNEHEGLISLTAHFVTNNFERKQYVLHVQPMSEKRHTADNLREIIELMLNNWGIEHKQVHVFLRDNGANIKKALEDSGLKSASCAAHNLNLVVTSAIEEQDAIKRIRSTCREIAGHFHRSDSSRKKLKELQQQRLGEPRAPLKLIQESKTRWNSTYHMIKRINELKESIILFSQDRDLDWTLKWTLIPKIIDGLKPFDDITNVFSSRQVTIGDVIPRIKWLVNTIEESDEQSGIKTMMSALKDKVLQRFSVAEQDSCFYLATALDPRYKAKMFTNPSTTIIAKLDLERMVKNLVDEHLTDDQPIIPIKRKRVEPCSSKDWLQFVQGSSDDEEDESSETANDNKEVENYFNEKRASHDTDPLEWWRANKKLYPYLAKLARRYLGAPATSVPSEQLFSGAGIIFQPLRNRISGESVEKLLFLKYNFSEFFNQKM